MPLAYLCISGALLLFANYAIGITVKKVEEYKQNIFDSKLAELYAKNYKHGSATKPIKQFTETELRESIVYYAAMRDQCTDTLEKMENNLNDFKSQSQLND